MPACRAKCVRHSPTHHAPARTHARRIATRMSRFLKRGANSGSTWVQRLGGGALALCGAASVLVVVAPPLRPPLPPPPPLSDEKKAVRPPQPPQPSRPPFCRLCCCCHLCCRLCCCCAGSAVAATSATGSAAAAPALVLLNLRKRGKKGRQRGYRRRAAGRIPAEELEEELARHQMQARRVPRGAGDHAGRQMQREQRLRP